MNYEQVRGGLESRIPIKETGDEIVLEATGIRKQHTGVHAKVSVWLNRHLLDEDTFNIGRRTDREKLARDAHKALNGQQEFYGVDAFKHDMLLFTRGLWEAHVGTEVGGWTEGETNPQPPDYLLNPYVLRYGGTIMFAAPKSGKSYAGLLWAVSMDAGVSKFWDVQPCRVLYINLERSEQSIKNRLGLVNEILGLPRNRPLLMLNRKGRSLADVYDAAKRMVDEYQVEHAMLDSLSRAGVGSMVKDDVANDSMDLMNALAPGWTVIAHTSREDATHVYGSQMFDAAADVLVRVRTELKEDSGVRGVGMTAEGNDIPFSPLHILAYEFGDVGLTGVREATLRDFPKLRDEDSQDGPRSARDRIHDQLLAHGAQTQKQLRDDLKLAPSTISDSITELKQDGKIREVGKSETNAVLYGVAETFRTDIGSDIGTTPPPP